MTPIIFLGLLMQPPGTTTQSAPAPSPALPQTGIFLAGGYGKKINGSLGYGTLLSQASGTYSYTRMLYLPVRGQAPAPTLLTGIAVHLRTFGIVDAYGLGQAGATTTATATTFSSALGGFVTVGTKWKRLKILLGVDSQKTASQQSFLNADLGIVVIP